MLKELMAKLRGARSAAEWDLAIADIETSITGATGNLGLLRTALRSAPFEQTEDEVRALRDRVRETEDEVGFLEGALEEARRRRTEAGQREDRAAVERLVEEAQADLRKQADMVANYIATLDKMAKSFVELDRVQRRLGDVNAELVRRGYPEDQLRFFPAWPGNVEAQINHMAQTLGGVANFNALRYLRDSRG